MPEGIVGIANSIQADRMKRIVYIQQDSIPGAGPSGQPDGGVDRYVVTLVGALGGLCSFAVVAALPEAVDGSRLRIRKDARMSYDLRQFRVCQRHLDDIDAESGGVGISRRILPFRTSG